MVSDKKLSEQIMQYLKDTNRPYSATDITLNLQLKKTATTKMLQEMAASESIAFKENGKQVIYYVHQADDDETEEEAAAVGETMTELATSIEELKVTTTSNKGLITELEGYPGDDKLKECIDELKEKRNGLMESLIELEKQPMDIKEKDQINKSYIDMMKLWNSRKKKCMAIVYELSEKMEKSPKEVMELCGLETDEDFDQNYKEYSKYL